MTPDYKWPAGKKFAFTVFDDTDNATLANVKEVYRFLNDLGFRTTKSVWTIKGAKTPMMGGDTCENPEYLKWILDLKNNGFEIGFHNATYHTSNRQDTIKGIDRFYELFGHDPHTMANHSDCEESIYWGPHRVSGLNRYIYLILTQYKYQHTFRGHIENDKLFWGDICQRRVKYVRNFIFSDLNTLKMCPQMPYHDPERPYVQYWFASTEGPTISSFLKACSEKYIEKLEEESGACIMYTHFANGFDQGGRLHQEFQHVMERLSQKNGWFVPVGELLDYILQMRGPYNITKKERRKLELKWLIHKIKVGAS